MLNWKKILLLREVVLSGKKNLFNMIKLNTHGSVYQLQLSKKSRMIT